MKCENRFCQFFRFFDDQFLLVAVGGVDVDGVVAVDVALDPDYLVAGLHVS